ncbi:uncharacterized protein SCODWIG_00870 [Saccharomycodes ludwigii]|uniref:Uncharacterized protein n=1 Tax=Saccharomycodes ludwigii TaxID=36035 RepID=A0A376B3E3_9ASCO|nr:uncharacterized protein SCODWIG_00870 [Saccharomycodes ludwigii]
MNLNSFLYSLIYLPLIVIANSNINKDTNTSITSSSSSTTSSELIEYSNNRPLAHLTLENGILGDITGLFYNTTDELYNIYYQYQENDSSQVTWRHSTSQDLTHWTSIDNNNDSIISINDSSYTLGGGSMVIDSKNSSGLFPSNITDSNENIIALYCSTSSSENISSVNLAYSINGGYTFVNYPSNPILQSNFFADPNVFWHEESNKWILTVFQGADYVLDFYNSYDLINWNKTSEFSNYTESNYQYGSPSLVRIPVIGMQTVSSSNTTTDNNSTSTANNSTSSSTPAANQANTTVIIVENFGTTTLSPTATPAPNIIYYNITYINNTIINSTYINNTIVNTTYINITYSNNTTYINSTFVNGTYSEGSNNTNSLNDSFAREWALYRAYQAASAATNDVTTTNPVTTTSITYKWVLFRSVNMGSIQNGGGSSAQYLIGDFDGEQFIPDDSSIRTVDYGKDFYGLQSLVNANANSVLGIGLAADSQYSANAPTSPWKNSLSLVRNLTLQYKDTRAGSAVLTLIAEPLYNGLHINGTSHTLNNIFPLDIKETLSYDVSNVNDTVTGLLDFQVTFLVNNTNVAESDFANLNFNFKGYSDPSEYLKFGFEVNDQAFYLDRSHSNVAFVEDNEFYSDKITLMVLPYANTSANVSIYKVQGVIDDDIIEIFINDGQYVSTNTYYFTTGNKIGTIDISAGIGGNTFTILDFETNQYSA